MPLRERWISAAACRRVLSSAARAPSPSANRSLPPLADNFPSRVLNRSHHREPVSCQCPPSAPESPCRHASHKERRANPQPARPWRSTVPTFHLQERPPLETFEYQVDRESGSLPRAAQQTQLS